MPPLTAKKISDLVEVVGPAGLTDYFPVVHSGNTEKIAFGSLNVYNIFDARYYGVSPASSGAVNRVALQAAIDAAETAGGGLVLLPVGTVAIGKTPATTYGVLLKTGVYLMGHGRTRSILSTDHTGADGDFSALATVDNLDTESIGVSDLQLLGIGGVGTITIAAIYVRTGVGFIHRRMVIDRVNILTPCSSGIALEGMNSGWISRVYVQNPGRHGLYPSGGCYAVVVDNCHFSGSGSPGGIDLAVVQLRNCKVTIKDCNIEGGASSGILIAPPPVGGGVYDYRGLVIEGNKIHGNGEYGIDCYGSWLSDVSIKGNDVYENTLSGMIMYGGLNNEMGGNRFHDNEQNGLMLYGPQLNIFNNNTFHNNSNEGAGLYDGLVIHAYAQALTVAFDLATKKFTTATAHFGTFGVGDVIVVTATGANDGTYTVASVIDEKNLTVAEAVANEAANPCVITRYCRRNLFQGNQANDTRGTHLQNRGIYVTNNADTSNTFIGNIARGNLAGNIVDTSTDHNIHIGNISGGADHFGYDSLGAGGTCTIANVNVFASATKRTRIVLHRRTAASVAVNTGDLFVYSIADGVGFVVQSSNAADDGSFFWELWN